MKACALCPPLRQSAHVCNRMCSRQHETPLFQVYKARCKSNGELVAVKKLNLEDFPIGSSWVRAAAALCAVLASDAAVLQRTVNVAHEYI